MEKTESNLVRRKKVYFTIALMGLIYALMVAPNHYLFRTYALDLGAYTNALYDYAHFQWNDSTVFKETAENLLADHFDLYLIIFSPLSYFFGSLTLLIVQIVFILLGGWGVYKYLSQSAQTAPLAIYGMSTFYLFFGVFSALSFDYHSNVIAVCVLPWLFIFFRKGMLLKTSFLLIFILIGKENMSLWLCFVCLGLSIEYRFDRFKRNYLLLASLASLFYFVLVLKILMPAFANSGTYPHFHYAALGSNMVEAIEYLLFHPIESFKILFTNHVNHANGDFIKAEFHILMLVSGLPLLILRPHYLLMIIPIYIQKLFHDNYSMWGIGGQYSIEFAPIMAIGIFEGISTIKKSKWRKVLATTVLILTGLATFRTMDNTIFMNNKANFRIYQGIHYKRNYDVKSVYKAFDEIPGDAVVSAMTSFVPHLAYRDFIYQFPIIKDAEYVIYSSKEGMYPIDRTAFDQYTHQLESDNVHWSIIIQNENVTLLKRN